MGVKQPYPAMGPDQYPRWTKRKSVPIHADPEQCPSGKRVYWTERLATRAVNVALERGELAPLRHYRCPDCDRWHLARKNKLINSEVIQHG